jgi:hypothetical protein
MPDDPKPENDKPEDDKPETEETEEETEEGGEDDKPEDKTDPEVAKAVKRRDLALKRAQKAESELKKYKEKEAKEGEDDPVAKANARLISASARTVLASAGVTDREDQKEVLAMLNLSDIDVDDTDGPDEDEIADRVERLRAIFSGGAAPKKRVPGSVKPKDRGGSGGGNTDPDKARYARIMGGR